jgi:nucleoid DNA-binding protein
MDTKRLLQDLTDGLSASQGIKKKEAEDFIRLYFDTIQNALLNDRVVKVNRLGTFKLIEVEARNSVNVNTGEAVVIPEHLKISFIPETSFKEAINKPFADFEPIEATIEKKTDKNSIKHDTPPINQTPVNEPTVQKHHTPPAYEPKKQPEIQELLDQLTTNDHPMKPVKPHQPVRTILLVVLGILLIASLTIWSVVSNQSAKKDVTEKLKLVEAYNLEDTVGYSEEPVLIESPAINDSIEAATQPVNQASKSTPTTEKPTSKRSIPSSVVIGDGDRLTLIAQTYYGHKVYWVYIYMENKEAISNPNNVPVGTTLRLPDKHPTLMDPTNAQSIQKAEALQDRIFNQLQTSRSK